MADHGITKFGAGARRMDDGTADIVQRLETMDRTVPMQVLNLIDYKLKAMELRILAEIKSEEAYLKDHIEKQMAKLEEVLRNASH